ncbi:MAG: hypothetical protein HY438_02630 [DPANN group archaeon]|nr:hypothetical protein [DPANN group archaeon]
MAFPVDIFGGGAVWALGGFGIFGVVIALTWALTRGMRGLAGAVSSEARAENREERLARFGLETEKKEIYEDEEALSEEGSAARDAQVEAASDAQASRAEAAGAAGPAMAAEKRAATAGKGEARLSNRAAKALAAIKKQKSAELKDAQKKIKDINSEITTAEKIGQNARVQLLRQKLQRIQMEEQRKQRELQFINRLAQQQKQGQMSIKITAKTRQQVMQQIQKGMAKQMAVVEQRVVAQERRRGFSEQQEAAALGQFLAAEEQDITKERAELQRLEAEKARLAWEEQTARAIDKVDYELGTALKQLTNALKNVLKTESKDTDIKRVLSLADIQTSQNLFLSVERAMNTYQSEKKNININIKRNAFLAISNILRSIVSVGKSEDGRLRAALLRLPNSKTKISILQKLDKSISMAEQLLPELARAEMALPALQA